MRKFCGSANGQSRLANHLYGSISSQSKKIDKLYGAVLVSDYSPTINSPVTDLDMPTFLTAAESLFPSQQAKWKRMTLAHPETTWWYAYLYDEDNVQNRLATVIGWSNLVTALAAYGITLSSTEPSSTDISNAIEFNYETGYKAKLIHQEFGHLTYT